MPRVLAVVLLVAMACAVTASAQGLRVEATRSPSGTEAVLRAGAVYVSNPSSEWLYADLAFEAFANGVIRPHRDIYLVGPAGARILPPDQRTYRENFDGIRAMMGTLAVSAGAARLPVRREFPGSGRPYRAAVPGAVGDLDGWRLRPDDRRPRRLRDGASGPDRIGSRTGGFRAAAPRPAPRPRLQSATPRGRS